MKKKKTVNKGYIYYFVLILFPLAVFWHTAGYSFVWDDIPLYLNKSNYPEQNRLANTGKFWTSSEQTMYAPVTYTVWGILSLMSEPDNSNEFGVNPRIFHIVNILVHIFNGILLFLILKVLLKNELAAIIGALVFSVHPVQVEAVAWISELRGLLSAMFGLLSIYYYLKYRLYINTSKEKIVNGMPITKNLVLTTAFFILSALSKPSGIVIPFIVLTLDLFYFKINFKKALWFLANYIIFVILISIRASSVESSPAANLSVPFLSKPLIFLDSISFYLYKIFVPVNYVASYGRTPEFVLNSSYLILTVLLPLIIITALIIYRKKLNDYISAFLIFIIGFLPVSGLVSFYYQFFSTQSDRYIYISMLAIAFFAGTVFLKIKNQTTALIFTAIILFVLVLQSYSQVPVWKNEFSLWNNSIENTTNQTSPPYLGRGEEYIKGARYNEAIEDFTNSIKYNPKESRAYYNRGNAYLDNKNYEKAIKDFTTAINLDNKLVNAYVNRALAYSEFEKPDMAISDYNTALKLNPNQSEVYTNRGVLFAEKGNMINAVKDFETALKLNPNDAEAASNLERAKQELINK